MSDQKKKKLETIVSPAGIAKFPRLNKPETEVNGKTLDKPRYKVTLVLDESAPGVAEFKAKLEKLHSVAIAVAEKARKADPKRAKKPLKVNDTIRPHTDESGAEVEGKFEITAKTNAETKDGTPKAIKMFDAKGSVVSAKIGGGSTLKLSLSPDGYDSNLGAGLSLYLNAVQIIDLQEFGGGNAKSFGFGEEEGYAAEEAPASEEGFGGEDSSSEEAPAEDAPRSKGDF